MWQRDGKTHQDAASMTLGMACVRLLGNALCGPKYHGPFGI